MNARLWREVCVGLALFLPAGWLLLAYWYWQPALGANPLETLLHTTGRCALVMLILSLAIRPLHDLGALLEYRLALFGVRRLLGLGCFSYALAHAWIFLAFDLGYDFEVGLQEVLYKPYLGVGALAFLLLIPMAITSGDAAFHRLGKGWFFLHRASYLVAILGLLHFWWQLKPGEIHAWPDTIAVSFLLLYRLFSRPASHDPA